MSDNKRHIRFAPISQGEGKFHSPKSKQTTMLRPLAKYGMNATLFIWICLLVLFVSNVLYLVGFVTDAWGVLVVEDSSGRGRFRSDSSVTNDERSLNHDNITVPRVNTNDVNTNSYHGNATVDIFKGVKESWEFGLWQCCRNDGFCVGPRFPPFYSVTRTFAVLGLFGHVLSFAWMLGHTLEQLVPFEPTAMIGLTCLIFATDLSALIGVCVFGTRWPTEFEKEYDGTKTFLSYSFYLVVSTVVLLTAAGSFVVADICLGYREVKMHEFVTAEKILKSKASRHQHQSNDALDLSDTDGD